MPDDTPSSLQRDTTDDRFERLDGAEKDRVDDFLRDRVTITAREWAIARLCADFRTGTEVERTTIGETLPELVPFLDEQYSRQAVYQARRSFERKVRKAGATFLYGSYADFFTVDEFDDIACEATEVARFLIEVEGASRPFETEPRAERRVKSAMAAIHRAGRDLRYDRCPNCGERLDEDAMNSPEIRLSAESSRPTPIQIAAARCRTAAAQSRRLQSLPTRSVCHQHREQPLTRILTV